MKKIQKSSSRNFIYSVINLVISLILLFRFFYGSILSNWNYSGFNGFLIFEFIIGLIFLISSILEYLKYKNKPGSFLFDKIFKWTILICVVLLALLALFSFIYDI